MATTGENAVQHEVRIQAKPETIFPFFTDPELMVRWKGITATLDAQPDGVYHVNVNGRDVARGEYVRDHAAQPHRVHVGLGGRKPGSPAGLQHCLGIADTGERNDPHAVAPLRTAVRVARDTPRRVSPLYGPLGRCRRRQRPGARPSRRR